ncbi:MAG: uroporphyrinogen decarboxylase [Flavobacteriales bacterium]|nr:MAG: uroporphyrinogen decarboxylase [Flavobacteriales bacterium]
MEYFSFTEIIGYLASLVVLLSFLMRDVEKLRMINIVGCSLFVAYGVFLGFSIPIIVTNVAIAIINLVYLIKSKKKAKRFDAFD